MIKFRFRAFLVVICLGFSIITVWSQFNYIYTHFGRDYVIQEDFGRHLAKLSGTAHAPYRYRILTDHILKYTRQLVSFCTPGGQQQEYELIAFGFRVAQNFIIFLLAFLYFRTLEISRSACVTGIFLLSSSLCFAFFQSDLSFYTYTELAFFLLAGILINLHKDWWILPLTFVATLNREGSIFIPIMLFSARLSQVERRQLFRLKFFSSQWAYPCALSLSGFFVIYFVIRYVMGPAEYAGSRYGAVLPGIQLLKLNMLNSNTWIGLAEMYSLLPLSLIFISCWHKVLRSYFLFLALPWFISVFIFGSADETRLFLVPLLIVFIPVMLKLVFRDNPQAG